LYDVELCRITGSCLVHEDAVSCLHWDEDLLVTGSWDSSVRLWVMPSMGPGFRVPRVPDDLVAEWECESRVVTCGVRRRNRVVYAGSDDAVVFLWDLVSQTELLRMHQDGEDQRSAGDGGKNVVTGVSLSEDGRKLVASTRAGRLTMCDLRTRAAVFSREFPRGIRCAAVAIDWCCSKNIPELS
jgi:factor associated with neutral sphingomyelinase activation